MNILVTGGAGFIGSHLCEKLVNSGNRVICVDNLQTGSRRNVEHLLKNVNFCFIKKSIIEPFDIKGKVDQIYNLACPASPVQYQSDPIGTIKANTIGVINVLELAKKNNAIILQASTSEVYGDPEIHPQTEDYRGSVNCFGPRACYDEGKRCAEALFYEYHQNYNLKIKVARIFNTYGPRMAFDDGRVVSNFIVQALKNSPLTIYGQGKQTRSFCFVDDLVTGLIALMNSPLDVIGPVNLGNPQECEVVKLARLVIKFSNSKSRMVFKKLPVDDPHRRCPDVGLAKAFLKWLPKINLEVGLKKTIADFKKRLT